MIFSRIILRLWRLTKPIFGKHKLTSPWNVNLFWRLTKPIFWQAQFEMWTYFLFSQIPLLECIRQGQTKWLKEGKPFKLQPRHFQSSYQTPAQPINQGQASIRQKPKYFSGNQTKKGHSEEKKELGSISARVLANQSVRACELGFLLLLGVSGTMV